VRGGQRRAEFEVGFELKRQLGNVQSCYAAFCRTTASSKLSTLGSTSEVRAEISDHKPTVCAASLEANRQTQARFPLLILFELSDLFLDE